MDTFVPAIFPWINPTARRLLRSLLHPISSWYVVVLKFRGRRTGRAYEVPLEFHRDAQGVIEAVTSREGRWWLNPRGQSRVTATIRGREQPVPVELVKDDADAINRALRTRDVWRRNLVPATPEQPVLLRMHVLPDADAR